ncbi:nesprin-2a isoform X4 [Embiotoca jacksoni]|uniref:nesprin-2a isoform X4 n=1 Tax=Embiotoca jacksoni TaxID=100190 RepID=UPI003704AD20
MASGGAEEDDGVIPLDIDNVHMLLQVEHEQIQRRTFTNWINAQLSKRCPPSFVSDLFSDLRDGSRLLDLLEVMSGQSMKRQRGRGVFQQRANIETALNFLKKKSIKLVNINIPDIIDGRPSIILGLVWTIILHCHIEELANTLSFDSRHSSLDSLASLDSWSGSPVPASPVLAGRTSPLHRRFRVSAKKALLMWVRDQCQRVCCSVSVKNFKSSWRSGEAFLAILCSLRPQLVDLSLVQSRSNQENLEEAFHLAEQELHIPRLLEPQDIDVKDPEEKSIMTYVAQFLQYSNDMPAPDDHLQLFPPAEPSFFSPVNLPAHFTPAIAVSPLHQVSPSERAQEVTCWLQRSYQELSEAWTAAEKSSYAEKYQVFQSLAGSFADQRRPVMTLLASTRRCPELNQEQRALRAAWDRLEDELQRCKANLDLSLPPPLDSVVVWLQRAEAGLTEDGGRMTDHAGAAKEARAQQDTLKTLNKEMIHYVNILDAHHNMDDSGNLVVPVEMFDEIKKRLTSVRVTAKYQGIKLEYQESRHTVLDLLSHIRNKLQSWKAPYGSLENIRVLQQDWHETVERQNLLLILRDALENLKQRANTYISKAALSEYSQLVTRQVKEAQSEAEVVTQAVTAAGGTMERATSAWETYNKCFTSLQAWLKQKIQSPATQEMSEWTSCQAQLNEAGNFLTEVTETSTSLTLAEQLSKVNMQWAECMKKTKFELSSEASVIAACLQLVSSLSQEASWLLRQPLEVASAPLKANRQKIQLLSKKMSEVDVSSPNPHTDLLTSHLGKPQQTVPQMLAEAERTCGELQRAASRLEGRLAELDHWSTDALDRYNHLKDKTHRGRSALEPPAKVLISRGVQLVDQVVTEGQDLQDFVAGLQKTSHLQHLSTSDMQGRISESVSHCQEILAMFSSIGLKQQVGELPKNQRSVETVCQTQKQTETGLFVVARTKHVDQIGNISLQTLDANQRSPQIPSPQRRTRGLQGWSENQHMNTQEGKDMVVPCVVIQMAPQPVREPVAHIHAPLLQSPKEAESEQSFPKSCYQASSFSQTPVGVKSPASPVLSEHKASSVSEQEKSSASSPTHNIKHKSRAGGQPNTRQSDKPPQPPVLVRSEVHSKAQSMARSRLEKARSRLQGHIQQAMKLFGGKEISESQVKKKQKALQILQPAVLEEFLVAVEGFGAFCSGPQLQDLMLLSDSVRTQWEAVTEGAASIEERVESLRELSETLTPRKSCSLATEQLTESGDVQETQPSDAAVPDEGRGRQLEGNTPVRATAAGTQSSNNLPQKQSVGSLQQDPSPVVAAASVQLHRDILPAQDIPTEKQVHHTQKRGCRSEQKKKPSLRAKEQLLKARLLHVAGSNQEPQTHTQAVVRSNTVETKQEAEWTVIPESAVPPQDEPDSQQGAPESYRKTCSVFQSQLQKNKRHLEQFISDPVTIVTLQNQRKHLQTLKQQTEALWFDVELQYEQLSRFPRLMTREEDWIEVERKQEQLTQQWGDQQMCLQTRMASLENTADLMESADHQRKLISDKLNQIIRESVDISSLTLADPTVLSHLKEMDDRLQAEMRKLSEQSTEEERRGPVATSPSSLCQPLHDRSGPLEQLRHQLEDVQSAARALHHFLSIVREVRAEIPKRDPCGQENEADGEQEKRAWQAAMQRLQAAAEQSDAVDRSLKAAGMTLTVDGAAVTCQDVVKSLSKQLVEVEKTAMKGRTKTREDELLLLEKRKTQEHEELNPLEIDVFRDDSPQQSGTQACSTPGGTEEESGSEAKKRRVKGENDTKTQREDQTRSPEGDVSKTKSQGRRRRSSQVKKEAKEKESLVQRRAALLAALRQTKGTAEQLRLQEPTLPALQQRRRALTELESALAGLLHEVQYIQGASSQPGLPDEGRTREVDDLWEETTKAVTDRLEQCRVLTELLKRFQGIRGELSGTLQRAESTISEQASYMGKDNLQRLHTQVQETKAELNVLGDDIEEVRSVCRQLHSHLRQIPGCNSVPFESEADALMDRWLDLSERTDSHLENMRRGLSLWDGVLQLGTEVESWTDSKLAVFAQRPSFESEEDIKALQDEIVTQKEIIKRFQQRTTEIQVLLQSTEPPPELQVVETHMKKKMEQLKELVAEAEDVYKQLVAAKGQITGRMAECFNSLQKIQDSLHTLSGRDVSTVLAKLKELCLQLRVQDEQAESLLEDVGVMASIAGPESFHSLSADGIQLQEKVRNAHQLFSEVEEQTKRNIQDLDRLQMEAEHLEQWLHAAEEKAAKETHVRFLQEEALQQSARTSLLSQLLSSLRSSSLQQSPLLEESRELLGRYHDFHADALGGSKETRCSPSRDIEGFHALSEATQSWVGDLRQIVDSPLDESFGVQNPAGQRLHCAQVLLRATTEAEARLEELRVAGDSLSCRLQRGDDLKRDVKERVQKAVEQWRELLQSAEPYYRTLKADPELASSYSARRQEACCKVEDLQHRTDRLPTFFPWPGTAERTQASLLARQLQEESESLQSILSGLAEQRRELAERTGDTIWKDSSRAEPDGCWSALMAELKAACSRLEEGASNEEHFAQLLQDCHHKLTSLQERMSVCQSQTESSTGLSSDVAALEALLQEVSNIGKDVLQLAALKDSIAVSSTAEAQASLTQQVSSLQNHKRALESSIRDNLTLLTANHNQRTQQVKGEASCLQTALKDLADNVNNLSGIHEVLPDISQLKQQWCTIQDLDTRLTELAARVNDLQTTTESNITQEKHPDVFLAVHADFKDLGSLRSILTQKKQECADITATRVRELISRLQRWSQTVRAEPSSPSQAALDEGLQLQQALHEVLSEQDFLLNCLGTEVAKKLEKSASGALGESQPALESLSKCLVSHDRSGVQLENRNLLSRRDEESLRSEGGASQSAPADDTTTTCPPASPFSSATDIKKKSENDDYDDKIQAKGIFRSLEKSHPSTEPVTDTSEGSTVEADATKQDPACTSMPKENISVTCTASSLMEIKEEDALAPIQVPHSENPDVFRSKMQQQSQQLTSTPPKINLKTFLRSTDDSGTMSTDINPQSSTPRTSGNNTRPLISDSLPQSLAQQGNTVPLQRDTTSAWVSQQSATDNNTEINSAQCVSSLIGSPDNLPLSFLENVSEHPPAQSETFKDITAAQEQLKHREDIGLTAKKVFTVVLDVEPQGMQQRGNAGVCSLDVLGCFQEAELYDAKITQSTGFPEKKAGLFTTSLSPESDERDSGAQSEILDAQEPQKCCEDVSGSPDEVLTRVLDMELQPKKIQQSQYDGASCPDVLRCSQEAEFSDAKLTEVSSTGFPEKKPGFFTALISPESAETDLKSHYLSSESNPTVLVKAKLQDVKPTSAKLQCKENLKAHESKPNEVSTSSTSRDTVAGFQLTGSHAAGTTSQDVQQEEGTDFCPHEERPVSSGGCTVEDSVQTEEALTETQISASDNKQVTAADAAHSATCEETAKRENTEEANDSECVESEHSKVPEIRNNALLLKEENGRRLPAEPEDTAGTQRQHQIRGGMEPERTAPGLSADLGAGDPTGGSSKHGSTMQGILSEIQSLVESSNIINRTPHIDLNWYLKSSPGEPEIRLVRTVQQVLACRYQPAQLSVTAMVKQLEEAQEFSRRVQEQVATMKNMSTTGVCDPNTLKCAEGQWSAALLDASATVQVKATQLDQVKLYHRQMKITRAFLEVIGAEKEKMSSNALGSSALQAEKLNALLQTMEQKKDIMKDLLCFSSQISVHLSDAESSGALLAQLGDVQEEWRLLEGSIKRALRHASNSSCQSSLLLKEAEQLKAKLDALQKFNCQSLDGKSALEFVCLTTDLKLYNQLYLHLQFQSDALINFSLGQKEKKEIERNLRGLESLLVVTKRKFDSFTSGCGVNFSTKINKQLQDLIVWAKQAENHITIGEKLALFPEEARIQIVEMKKFQTDILRRRSKMRVQVEEMKNVVSDMEMEDGDQVLKTVEDLYGAISDSLDHILDTMKKNLNDRENLLCGLANMDAWLAETHAERDPCTHVENVSGANIGKLESELKSHKLATVEIENQLKLLEAMLESCRKIATGLSPGESRYLVNRLSGLWTELDGLLAQEKATSWELEEVIHERTSSDDELSTVKASLKQISSDLEQQKFPLTQETLSTVARLKHMLMEHQCEVQELQHCQEAKRSSLLCTIGELQDRCKTLSINAFEQDKYLHLRRQMEESRDIAKGQIEHAQNKAIGVGERFRLCQTLLVELPLVRTQCQEAADQLEAIAQEIHPTELSSERERIHRTVETLVAWELSVTDDIKNLEAKLLLGLQFNSELPAFIELLQNTREALKGAEPVSPEEKAIDCALRQSWVIWRNMESGMRVLEGLGQKEKLNLRNYKELYSLRDAAMQECHAQMVGLSQARESLKDYQWAAQGALGFLHNAEATFLSAPGGFLDCTEEQRQTQQALEALEDGFQAHICHIVERVPQQTCLSRPKTEQLHIGILSQLQVGRGVLEAQAQLRLESLQRCEISQQNHRKCHEDICRRLSEFEPRLSDCAAEQVTSYDRCVAQQRRAKLLMEELRSLAGRIEDLRAGCPMQGCGVGKDGELGALWRRWVSVRRGVSLLMAHTEQRGEEWKDIRTSMEQCCSSLASLQAEVPDSSTVSFIQEEPQELLTQAEMHQAGLEQEQQALASLEHRLEHALSLSTSHEPVSPGPVGKTLVKIQENVRSLKERNLLVVAAAQAEERDRQQVQEEIGEVERHLFSILPALEASPNTSNTQELRKDLSSQKTKLKCIMDGVQSRYAEIPADIGRVIHEVELSLQRAEEKIMEKDSTVGKLACRVRELGFGLEKVKVLLEQRSPTVSEAQNVLKCVWDELDTWHSSLMVLENEVQDLTDDQPHQAQLLIEQLTQPLQLYQDTARMAEQRTAFLSKIPACLQEFKDILCSATCWLDEAQSWLSAPCSFTTARNLQNHAKSLQLVLEDSERIRHALQDFRPVLAEISVVCDISTQEERLDQDDQQVHEMQCNILEPLEKLLQSAAMVEAMEAELKAVEKNVSKIRTILSSMDVANITLTEHLQNRQVILDNVRSMQGMLKDIDKCKGDLHVPRGAEEGLLVFSRAQLLLQQLEEVAELTQQQASLLENKIMEEEETNEDPGIITVSDRPEETQGLYGFPHRRFQQEVFELSNSDEEEDEEDESYHSSSSDTLTCSIPEDPEETLSLSDAHSENMTEINPEPNVKELQSLVLQFSSKVEMSSKSAETSLLSAEPGFGCENVQAGLITLDSEAHVGKAFSPETATAESVNTDTAAEDQFKVAAADQNEPQRPETSDGDARVESPPAAAAVEDTRLIPLRPITPFTAKRLSTELTEEEGEGRSPSAAARSDQALSSNQLSLLDEFEPRQSEMFPSLKAAPSLECAPGRHLRERPGEKAELQRASRSSLRGIARLLQLGEERMRGRQRSRVHSRGQLQAVLCRHEKLLQVLRSQLAFVQYLFQNEPEALKCQEDERVQLEIRAKALQQQAVEQEVASQRRLWEWTRWEDNCGRLGRVLDESEAFISCGEPEGDENEEEWVQLRLDACQQTLVRLDESGAALGLLLDQGKELQAQPGFAFPVSQAGGALELRWRSAYRRTEQEIQRCRDIRDRRARFQSDSVSVSKWLVGADKHLKALSGLAETSDLNQECVQSSLIKLLDFSMEVEGMSPLKTSVVKDATRLLHLREADCPELRTQLTQLENSWNQLTSDLSKTQDHLQQRLVAAQPPAELLPDLQDWLKKMEARLNQEKQRLLKATNAAQISEILQQHQVLKAAVANAHLLLDFLCQPGLQTAGGDVQALRSERTAFAEELGVLQLQWLNLQRELESQIHGAEQIHHACAERERRLQGLHSWMEQQKKQLSRWKRPTSRTAARQALPEWEAAVGRAKEVAAAIQELKTRRVHDEEEKEEEEGHPWDVAFFKQAESIGRACEDLSQQLESVRAALQQAVEDWSCFHRTLRDVTLNTTRVRCALQRQQTPLLSLQQAEGYCDLLQLQVTAGGGEELWLAVDKPLQRLVETLHRGAAQALRDQVEGERKRWKDVVQEIQDEHLKTGKTRSLWQDYTRLSESCSRHQRQVWHQWEELSSSPLSPEHDTQAVVDSVQQKLQDDAEELQSSVGNVLAASKHLVGRLEPLAANLIQSETRVLSRDILLLNQVISGKRKSLQEDLEQKNLYHTRLEAFEEQTQNSLHKLKADIHDADSVKQVLSELSDLLPSLVDLREMSDYVGLNNRETERLHTLSREWAEGMTRTADMNRNLQEERQRSQNFQEKCKNLTSVQEKLERESACRKPPSYSSLREMLSVHQRLQAEIVIGHQLLQRLHSDAVESAKKETAEKRCELLTQVARMKESWSNCTALVDQNRTSMKEQLHRWRIYQRGLKLVRKLLRDVDSLLPPTGPSLCTLHQLHSYMEDNKRVEECLDLHSPVYTRTLEAGKHLCETMTESECRSGLQSELQAVEEAWERTTSLLRRRTHLVNTAAQTRSRCQEGITNITSELDELKLKLLEGPEDSEDKEPLIQETELSLQRLAGGLRELATMKTDLSQYVAASESALLEQQLEQLHGQWEELCMKVSLRRQEVADRINAWTIFNDKNKEFCDWLTQMENKVCRSGELSIEEMVDKLKKDCMEEINLFSENKSHLKQLGEQLLLASDEAKQTQVHGSLQEVNQRWHHLFHHIESRVKKLKETLVTVQQLDKNMSNLRSWLSRIEAELSRPIKYSVCHEQEIQRRLAEQQELQRDIEQHTEGVASVLSLCDVLLRDGDAGGGTEAESDSLQETSRSLDQRWRTICALALDRRLRIEETWSLWCKFLNDYSQFEDWLKMAEQTAASPNSADVLFTVAKEELKKFEGFQRQVHERLTQLELVNNQYRRLARENRTDRASQLKAMVHEGNRRWDILHRRVAAILRRLKYFTSQREEFEGTRESMVVWLTELDLQLTNVEHFLETDVHHKIQQLNSFQKEITLNTERIDGLIVFGEGLIQKSSQQDAALIEDELEELHSYCQEVFSRLVRFHQRLSQPPVITEEPELSTFSLESSLELIGRPWLGRSQGSLPATPIHLLTSPLERSGRETPVSVDSLPLEWDHTGDVGGSSSHEDDDGEGEDEEEGAYFSAISVSRTSLAAHESPRWSPGDSEEPTESTPILTSTPLKPGYLRLMSQCSGSIENLKRVSMILDDEEQPEEFGLTGLTTSDKQSGVIERWELLQAQSRNSQPSGPQEPRPLASDLHDIASWLESAIPELDRLQQSEPAGSIEDMEARAKELKEMQKTFSRYKSTMLSVNLRAEEAPQLQDGLTGVNRDWSRACTRLQRWDTNLRRTLMCCQEFQETLHSLLLWLAHAESRRYAVDISHPDTPVRALQQHSNTLTELQEELRGRRAQQASLQALWSQLQPEDGAEESVEAREKLHVTGSKLKTLLRQVDQDLSTLRQRLESSSAVPEQKSSPETSQAAAHSKKGSSTQRERRESSPPRSFFSRVLRAAFPLQLLLLFLLLLPCLIPLSETDPSCSVANNFARSFYPMLRYTNGPPPT